MRGPLTERFWQSVRKTSGCWFWTGSQNINGYGRIFASKSKAIAAHRLSWTLHRGAIPNGQCVLHRCDVRLCVNPDHLWLGTVQQNSQDMMKKGRSAKGEKHSHAVLTEQQVKKIRAAKTSGSRFWGRKELARAFGVTEKTISRVANGIHWNHV